MEILYSFLIIFVGVFFMIQAGKVVVRSLGITARFLRLSEYVISFILIALATSLPELSVGVNSAILGIPELSLGDIIGTNIVNFSLILGVVAIVGSNVELKDYHHFKKNRPFILLAMLAPLLLILDGVLSRIDGVILILLFAWNLIRILDIDEIVLNRKVLRPHLSEYAHDKVTSWKKFLKYLFLLLAGVSVLITSALFIVRAVEDISVVLGVSSALIGVLVIAVCTSLPELIVGLRSVRSNKGSITLGDILGSATINSTLVLGTVALISPITLQNQAFVWVGILFTIASLLLLFYFLRSKHAISRKEGCFLFGLYILFVLAQLGIYFY